MLATIQDMQFHLRTAYGDSNAHYGGKQRISYREILPNLGANRNFPKAYRCAPNNYFGLDLPHPYVEGGIHDIHYLLMHGVATTETGGLWRTSIE
jgi:hypothetical protein